MVIEVLDQTKCKLLPTERESATDVKALGYSIYDNARIMSDFEMPSRTGFTVFVEAETYSDFAFLYRRSRDVRLEYPNRTPPAIANGQQLAKEIQQSLSSIELGSFDDEMKSLRGRSWSL